ncbi:DNA-3-methyladenine glycosylase [Conexibacter sp. DBS9H8]|uniref:DNA-3-methyladenine glycosylase n=1 Tax=Conexibacter sp. DBS9H8 TaxID=2937801 RepID=UPI00200EA119|nr:DNA-3-methyladenine glycosylase [Conexibacter sp. DBS9H8]
MAPPFIGRRRLGRAFFARPVLTVAAELIGCVLATGDAAGVIVETEAYHDSEPACHAHVGLTARTATLFGPPGIAYVYRSYGVHALVNAVCEPEGVGAAVLIRGLEPVWGQERMALRRRIDSLTMPPRSDRAHARALCAGPGRLSQALGITLTDNGSELSRGRLSILSRGPGWEEPEITTATRIGITKAVGLPWRFCAVQSACVSVPPR